MEKTRREKGGGGKAVQGIFRFTFVLCQESKIRRTSCCFFFGVDDEGEADKVTPAYAFGFFVTFFACLSLCSLETRDKKKKEKKRNGILMDGRLKRGSRFVKRARENLLEDLEFQVNLFSLFPTCSVNL